MAVPVGRVPGGVTANRRENLDRAEKSELVSTLGEVFKSTTVVVVAHYAGLTVAQYLARLAAEATTIINAEDYGRTVYDLSIRRDLIAIGEDMVNTAYDAPVDATPASHIEDAERKLELMRVAGEVLPKAA